ncbi:hypothetical protein RPMA_13105 [Tardiphaga alba]|uniref:Homogentisate 1,2-dioxygenase n=1 Tax=Tardiphaga alba TaxID=340268 RepID=A0ABX8A7Q2_9BRAD|nr:hypothetical protein [Tardiphaga alba]QUS39672.1 hypothetical protein RPMA_13105 [Tardiphaga alba]
MQARLIIAICLLGTAPAWAAEQGGCDKFKWPADKAIAVLSAPDRAKMASGGELQIPAAAILELKRHTKAELPMAPERKPREGSFAGFVSFKGPSKAGVYTVNLSSRAWIDVVQNDKRLNSIDHSGATSCNGMRKSVKYDLSAGPLVVQVSDVNDASISLAVLPAD